MKTAPALDRFDVRLLAEEELAECCRLISGVFGLALQTVEDWMHKRLRTNPWQSRLQGPGIGIWEDGRLIACRMASAQPWQIEQKEAVIAFAAHTCLSPAYQGQGLGQTLVEESKDLAALSGSTSAGVRTQPLYAKTGFQKVGSDNDFFRCRVSFGKSLQKRFGAAGARVVGPLMDLTLGHRAQRAGGYELIPVERCGAEFDELWRRARTGYAACLERSSRYLNWRIFDAPTWPLQIAALHGPDNQLRGFGVWHETGFGEGIRMAVLRDFFTPLEDQEARQALLALLLRHWRRDGLTWASLEVAHPAVTELFRDKGFEHVPSRGSRYQVFSHHCLAEKTLGGWLRSGLDGDYFDIAQANSEIGFNRD